MSSLETLSHRSIFHKTVNHFQKYLGSRDTGPVASGIRTERRESWPQNIRQIKRWGARRIILDQLARNVDSDPLGTSAERFFGWVIGGVLPFTNSSNTS